MSKNEGVFKNTHIDFRREKHQQKFAWLGKKPIIEA